MLAGAAAEYERVNHTYRPQAMRAYLEQVVGTGSHDGGAAAAKLLDEGRRLSLEMAVDTRARRPARGPLASRPGTGTDPA